MMSRLQVRSLLLGVSALFLVLAATVLVVRSSDDEGVKVGLSAEASDVSVFDDASSPDSDAVADDGSGTASTLTELESSSTTGNDSTSSTTSGNVATSTAGTKPTTASTSSSGTQTTQTGTPNPVPKPGSDGAAIRHIGAPFIMQSLGDTEVGGNSNMQVDHMMRFSEGGTIESLRPFIRYEAQPDARCGANDPQNASGGCYHKGDGGTFELALYADDGTSNHNPTGSKLATTGNVVGSPPLYKGSGPSDAVVGPNPKEDGRFRQIDLKKPVRVEANTWYHLVMTNTSDDPKNNFVSSNALLTQRRDSGTTPVYSKFDYALKMKKGSGAWELRDRHIALVQYNFSDGRSEGLGYMENSGPADEVAKGVRLMTSSISHRQSVTVSKDVVVKSINLGAMYESGTNSMTASIKDSAGKALWTGKISNFPKGTIPNDRNSRAASGVAEFRGTTVPNLKLVANKQYFLEFNSDGGRFAIFGPRDGALSWGYSQQVTVKGSADYKSGSSWVSWPTSNGTKLQRDLAFYLGVAQ